MKFSELLQQDMDVVLASMHKEHAPALSFKSRPRYGFDVRIYNACLKLVSEGRATLSKPQKQFWLITLTEKGDTEKTLS